MLRNAELGFCNGGTAPLGYRFVKVDYDGKQKTKLEPDETTEYIIREIFDLYLMGAGYHNISIEIREKYGRKITKTTLESILRNKAYKGWIVFQPKRGGVDADQPGVETPGAHQAIIDEAIFDQIQEERIRRGEVQVGRTQSRHSIFTGLLHCAHCGAKLTWETALGRGKKRYTYYSCSGKKKDGTCQGLRLPANKLDPFLLEVISERIFSLENLHGVFDELAKLQRSQPQKNDEVNKKIRQQLEKINKKIARLVEATAEGVLQLNEVKDKINTMRQEKRRLEQSMEDHSLPIFDFSAITDEQTLIFRQALMDMMAKEKPLKARHFLRRFISDIIVSETEVKVSYILSNTLPNKPDVSRLRGLWLPVCNPLHNPSLSPAVNRKPSISTGYQRSGRSW